MAYAIAEFLPAHRAKLRYLLHNQMRLDKDDRDFISSLYPFLFEYKHVEVFTPEIARLDRIYTGTRNNLNLFRRGS